MKGWKSICRDNSQAWLLQSDGSYLRAPFNEGEPLITAQQVLLERLT